MSENNSLATLLKCLKRAGDKTLDEEEEDEDAVTSEEQRVTRRVTRSQTVKNQDASPSTSSGSGGAPTLSCRKQLSKRIPSHLLESDSSSDSETETQSASASEEEDYLEGPRALSKKLFGKSAKNSSDANRQEETTTEKKKKKSEKEKDEPAKSVTGYRYIGKRGVKTGATIMNDRELNALKGKKKMIATPAAIATTSKKKPSLRERMSSRSSAKKSSATAAKPSSSSGGAEKVTQKLKKTRAAQVLALNKEKNVMRPSSARRPSSKATATTKPTRASPPKRPESPPDDFDFPTMDDDFPSDDYSYRSRERDGDRGRGRGGAPSSSSGYRGVPLHNSSRQSFQRDSRHEGPSANFSHYHPSSRREIDRREMDPRQMDSGPYGDYSRYGGRDTRSFDHHQTFNSAGGDREPYDSRMPPPPPPPMSRHREPPSQRPMPPPSSSYLDNSRKRTREGDQWGARGGDSPPRHEVVEDDDRPMEISIQRDRHRREHLEPQQQPQQAYRREQQRQLYRDRDRVGHPPRHSNNHGGRSRGGVRGNPQVFKQQLPEKYAKFGAYHNYYSRRNADRDRFIENDYRCQAIRDEYINEKVCLDIGCNEGLVGINLAVAYGSRKMWGIDVDPTLIQKAEKNLKQRKEEEKDKWSLRQSERERERERQGQQQQDQFAFIRDQESREYAKVVNALNGCKFLDANFMIKHKKVHKKGHFDTIICLSVTKWIHLCYGDKGLETCFKWMCEALKPKGHLILEAQPKESYRNVKSKNELKKYFKEDNEEKMHDPNKLDIQPYANKNNPNDPGGFANLLCGSEYGLKHIKETERSGSDRSFQGRTVYVFQKD